MKIAELIPMILLILCAIGVNFAKTLLQAVIVFMAFSSVMCIVWLLMESPDLAITEAAVGTGITSLLYFLTLKKIHAIDARNEAKRKQGKDGRDGGEGHE